MWSTSDTTAALVKARNLGLTLSSVKAGGDGTPTDKGGPVAPMLESLGAVIPTGVAAAYTTVAVTVHQFALSAREPGAANQESDDFAALRIAFLLLAVGVAVVLSYRAASAANGSAAESPVVDSPMAVPEANGDPVARRDRVLAEPAAAGVAFLGLALASPGTPLAMYLTPSAMQVVPVLISGAAVLLLMAIGTELTKPAKTGTPPQSGDYQV